MSGLDRIRVPETKRWIASVIIGVAVLMGGIASLQWWLQDPMPRGLIAVAVSALIGWIVARVFLRQGRSARGRR